MFRPFKIRTIQMTHAFRSQAPTVQLPNTYSETTLKQIKVTASRVIRCRMSPDSKCVRMPNAFGCRMGPDSECIRKSSPHCTN